MKSAFKHYLASMLLCFFVYCSSSAQLAVDTTYTPTDLVDLLTGIGVKVSNIQMNCDSTSYSFFDGSAANIGMSSGVLLSTGPVHLVAGPNTSTSTGGGSNRPGLPFLDSLAGNGTFDPCILEFDFEPVADTLIFRYVFASEEYPEFVCSQFNDVFAFLISGAIPGGGNYVDSNIATVPNKNIPVAINTINSGICGGTYLPTPTTDLTNSAYYVDNTGGLTVEYDGFTTVLTAEVAVIPCTQYHLTMAIADAGDGAYDSGIFLEAGSLGSKGIGVSTSTDSVGILYAVEDCLNGKFKFFREPVNGDSVVINFTVSGSATRGVDYIDIADSVIILPFQRTTTLDIIPIVDNVPEGAETVVLNFSKCISLLSDSNVLVIRDEFITGADDDITYCFGFPNATVSAYGGSTYKWSPEYLFDNPNLETATIKREFTWENRTVYVDITNRCGTYTDTVEVTFEQFVDLNIKIGNSFPADTAVFLENTLQLETAGSKVARYNWQPTEGLSCSNCSNPLFFGKQTNTYILEVEDENGCLNYDTIVIRVIREVNIFPPNAFTPNNDGINDFFEIATLGIATIDEIKIFNRWGTEVYGLEGLEIGGDQLKYKLWNGIYKNEAQPVGTYVFYMNATGVNGLKVYKQGDFSILK